jgi:hypothetical protein
MQLVASARFRPTYGLISGPKSKCRRTKGQGAQVKVIGLDNVSELMAAEWASTQIVMSHQLLPDLSQATPSTRYPDQTNRSQIR